MKRRMGFSVLPVAMALGALFIVLPRTGVDATVRMERAGQGWRFAPATVQIAEGARVEFRNDSRVTHTATCVDCPWDTGDVAPGASKVLVFTEAAQADFVCRYHGRSAGMTGKLQATARS